MRAFLLFFIAATAFGADTTALVPLNDLGTAPYNWGYYGGLYDDGTSVMPADHFALGIAASARIQPLDTNGNPSPNGKIAFLVAGFDETQKIADAMQQMAANDIRVNHDSLVIVNAGRPGIDGLQWVPPLSPPLYSSIRNILMPQLGVTPKQVQVAWVQLVTNNPVRSLPPQDADAYRLKGTIAAAIREMKVQYPNLRIAYISSRVYGGYATTSWNPEPFAYESAYSVRWLIMRQEDEERTGMTWDTRVGAINDTIGDAPWFAWGPYLWANGTTPRSDGLTWDREDFDLDGETLSARGAQKGGALLLDFLLHEPTAQWFRNPNAPARPHAARH
jgi:hypothetical protein